MSAWQNRQLPIHPFGTLAIQVTVLVEQEVRENVLCSVNSSMKSYVDSICLYEGYAVNCLLKLTYCFADPEKQARSPAPCAGSWLVSSDKTLLHW
jgi:hypothetical protein